jgi:capsular exopolysaccharide synthesis family protein
MTELQRTYRQGQRLPAHYHGEDIEVIDLGPGGREDAGLFEYWYMVRRNRGMILLVALVGAFIGFLMTLASPRIYQARVTLEIQGYNTDFLNMGSVTATTADAGYDAVADLQTHVRILQSRTVRERAESFLEKEPPPADLQPPDRLGMWRRALNLNPPTREALYAEALGMAAGSVAARTSGVNRIVEVTCDSTSGQVAADYCNKLTTHYIDQNLESRWQSTEYTGQWLTKQLQDLKIKMEQAQDELQAYLRKTGLIVTSAAATSAGREGGGDRANVQEVRLSDLLKELSAAQTDRIAKQSRYELAFASAPGGVPEVLEDESLRAAQGNLQALEAKLAQLSVTFTPNHAEVRRVRAEIAAIESSLKTSRGDILAKIRTEFEAARRRESLLQGEYVKQASLVSGQAEQTAHYNLLNREVDATRMMYDNLLQRTKEASVASALRANNIRVVDEARRPGSPYSPNVPRQVVIGLLFGLVAGIVLVIVRERADRTLQDPGDITHYLGLPELGVIPTGEQVAKLPAKGGGGAGSGAFASLMLRYGEAVDRVEMVAWHRKNSLLAESFRTTLTSILFSRNGDERPRVLVFTSASPKEGKTTTVCNLGIALAEINQRVLLIDADMRRPRLHQVFGLENDNGLSELLLQKRPLDMPDLEAVCVPTRVPGLFVLPSGSSRQSASSLLFSTRFAELVEIVRTHFDTVAIDTPPMVNLADARVVARLGDGLILLVRSGSTTRHAARLATSRFAEDGIPILGTILNCWNPKSPGNGYYQYYYSGYYHYYGDGSGGDGGGDGGGTDASAPQGATSTVPDLTIGIPQPEYPAQRTSLLGLRGTD